GALRVVAARRGAVRLGRGARRADRPRLRRGPAHPRRLTDAAAPQGGTRGDQATSPNGNDVPSLAYAVRQQSVAADVRRGIVEVIWTRTRSRARTRRSPTSSRWPTPCPPSRGDRRRRG